MSDAPTFGRYAEVPVDRHAAAPLGLGPERIGDIEHSHTAPRAGAAPGRFIVSIVP